MSSFPIPYYRSIAQECDVFDHAYRNKLPLLLKGPTGCGKSRFVEFMAAKLQQNLVTVSCHDETSASDLLGRYLVKGSETVWQDGPLTQGLRAGSVVYLDEIAEARPDTIVSLHSLTDHRRVLFLDRHDEIISAPNSFMLVASFNPGYQRGFKELKPSTRQRFISLRMGYPAPAIEAEIVQAETLMDLKTAAKLVQIAQKIRNLVELGLAEDASTRLLIDAGKLIGSGLPPRLACETAIVEPLTDDEEVAAALKDVVALIL